MPTVQSWKSLALKLRGAGLEIFGQANIKIVDHETTSPKVVVLLLLARTLSNLKASLLLIENGSIVEARTIARCCYENQFWAQQLTVEGSKFIDEMVGHEMKHKRLRAQTMFNEKVKLDEKIEGRLREWMRESKNWHESKTLDPKFVASRHGNQSYLFFQMLSLDAHPSIETLNRYYSETPAEQPPEIVVEPNVHSDEAIEALNLLCLPVIGVLAVAAELLMLSDMQVKIGEIASEYKLLTEQSGANSC